MWVCLWIKGVRVFIVLLANVNPDQPTRRNKLVLPVLFVFMWVLPAFIFSASLVSVAIHVCIVCTSARYTCSFARAVSVTWNSSSLHLTDLQKKPPGLKSKGFGFPYQSAIFHFQEWILIKKLLNKFTGVSILFLKLQVFYFIKVFP